MTLLRHELKAGRLQVAIWSGTVSVMTLLTMLLYPSFRDQMDSVSKIFAMMGPFTAALGMDVLPLGTAVGFYGIENGTMLAIGGTMFAAFTGIAMLAKEEGGHTAEFLLTQPISREKVVVQKLLALALLLVMFNAVCALVGVLCFAAIGEALPRGTFLLFHALQLMLHLEIACVCFAISAFCRRAPIGLGLGIALLLYCVSLLTNAVDAIKGLRFLTPFSYADASMIFAKGATDPVLVAIGAVVTVGCALLAVVRYRGKDIAA